MKQRLILLISLIWLSLNANAQTQNSEDTLRNALRAQIKKKPTEVDASNFKTYPTRARAFEKKMHEKEKLATTVVIIDNKIFRLNSPEYMRLTNDSLVSKPVIIQDTNSVSGIKCIMILKTKNGTKK